MGSEGEEGKDSEEASKVSSQPPLSLVRQGIRGFSSSSPQYHCPPLHPSLLRQKAASTHAHSFKRVGPPTRPATRAFNPACSAFSLFKTRMYSTALPRTFTCNRRADTAMRKPCMRAFRFLRYCHSMAVWLVLGLEPAVVGCAAMEVVVLDDSIE
ncbi:uncharacterized protein LACBIDRAFT_304333 [Laccaria bicolor S238N-H82]|uniref:Predicted protein n=1 Tax=Laccaria bicolor (strain S238N-H82 / ATCC MYA-4686) TaxID=486041 RepID=B0DLE8_LACBS|nr:uncharacterized protein LACBIDRAFT_304333 [Laccaria bicolor S238N-H82]EDR04554.1 predicted protein [Laccaria bicolor S238N-H82]|eukprot:XP_001884726.1 predicted protein [Laccaria bicolor S238N-H82]